MATYKITGFTLPFLSDGVHTTISLQPASIAGMPNINKVENNGAVPPGIYKPTFSIATALRQHTTPLVVSILVIVSFCAS